MQEKKFGEKLKRRCILTVVVTLVSLTTMSQRFDLNSHITLWTGSTGSSPELFDFYCCILQCLMVVAICIKIYTLVDLASVLYDLDDINWFTKVIATCSVVSMRFYIYRAWNFGTILVDLTRPVVTLSYTVTSVFVTTDFDYLCVHMLLHGKLPFDTIYDSDS